MELREFEVIPEGFLDADPRELLRLLGGPALIHVPGRIEPPLFVSTLLHGNETSGVRALQGLLREALRGDGLPERALSILIGNPEAAAQNVRRLPNQLDFNRVWAGGGAPEHRLATHVIERMQTRGLFAVVDVHNNTGRNPHYACVNDLEPRNLALARRFGRQIVYFTEPHEVCSIAFARHCPAITVECGRAGEDDGIAHVRRFLAECLELAALPDEPPDPAALEVYHSVARLLVPPEARIAFGGATEEAEGAGAADFRFPAEIEALNFTELPEHSRLGWRLAPDRRLVVLDEQGRDVGEDYLRYEGDEIRTARPVVPAMLSTSLEAIRQDCLGYFMQRYAL